MSLDGYSKMLGKNIGDKCISVKEREIVFNKDETPDQIKNIIKKFFDVADRDDIQVSLTSLQKMQKNYMVKVKKIQKGMLRKDLQLVVAAITKFKSKIETFNKVNVYTTDHFCREIKVRQDGYNKLMLLLDRGMNNYKAFKKAKGDKKKDGDQKIKDDKKKDDKKIEEDLQKRLNKGIVINYDIEDIKDGKFFADGDEKDKIDNQNQIPEDGLDFDDWKKTISDEELKKIIGDLVINEGGGGVGDNDESRDDNKDKDDLDQILDQGLNNNEINNFKFNDKVLDGNGRMDGNFNDKVLDGRDVDIDNDWLKYDPVAYLNITEELENSKNKLQIIAVVDRCAELVKQNKINNNITLEQVEKAVNSAGYDFNNIEYELQPDGSQKSNIPSAPSYKMHRYEHEGKGVVVRQCNFEMPDKGPFTMSLQAANSKGQPLQDIYTTLHMDKHGRVTLSTNSPDMAILPLDENDAKAPMGVFDKEGNLLGTTGFNKEQVNSLTNIRRFDANFKIDSKKYPDLQYKQSDRDKEFKKMKNIMSVSGRDDGKMRKKTYNKKVQKQYNQKQNMQENNQKIQQSEKNIEASTRVSSQISSGQNSMNSGINSENVSPNKRKYGSFSTRQLRKQSNEIKQDIVERDKKRFQSAHHVISNKKNTRKGGGRGGGQDK